MTACDPILGWQDIGLPALVGRGAVPARLPRAGRHPALARPLHPRRHRRGAEVPHRADAAHRRAGARARLRAGLAAAARRACARAWLLIGLAGLPALLAGLAEDLTGGSGVRYRLLATMGAGVVFALLTGYTMHEVDLPGVDWLLSFYLCALLFTGFSMGGVANAINIIDGFNGLAAGLADHHVRRLRLGGAPGSATTWSSRWRCSTRALVLGFFLVNFPLGKIFLGDGGAYFAGFLLASLGVLLPMRNPETSAWTAILICAYPVIETLASMRRKARRDGHSVGQPDRVHFHMLAYRRYARRLVTAPRAGAPAQSRDQPRHLGAAAADRASSPRSPTTACWQRVLLLRDGVHLWPALPGDVAQRARICRSGSRGCSEPRQPLAVSLLPAVKGRSRPVVPAVRCAY